MDFHSITTVSHKLLCKLNYTQTNMQKTYLIHTLIHPIDYDTQKFIRRVHSLVSLFVIITTLIPEEKNFNLKTTAQNKK